jgi:hypothetical protein
MEGNSLPPNFLQQQESSEGRAGPFRARNAKRLQSHVIFQVEAVGGLADFFLEGFLIVLEENQEVDVRVASEIAARPRSVENDSFQGMRTPILEDLDEPEDCVSFSRREMAKRLGSGTPRTSKRG